MKKDFQIFEAVSDEELIEVVGGNDVQAGTITITIPISLAICPTTGCASITRPCV